MKIGVNYLSFMDVMSCGMGSLFFLFFVFVTLKPEIQLEFFEKNLQKNKYKNPLVIIINSSEIQSTCFSSDTTWKLPDDYVNKSTTQNSSYYAVLYGLEIPSHGEILVGPIETEKKIDIQIFHGSLEFRHKEIMPKMLGENYINKYIQVWPVPKIGKKE